MVRADVCSSDDHETIARLQAVLREQGVVADDTWHDSPLGVGLQRFRCGKDELTVFVDAWMVDIAGPKELVDRVLAALSAG
ncbi:hypothetical protein [Fimbriiglobus ruber]|uniref:Uncharacterized protein n=1 Tax=Fimbriiglobus ruber TaxID=1908690 RepID=A0A225DHW2_9BACT|nr:hypothetical protein [Fimbriiglobus ruber]OWK35955.1 hypothetical protein FRUB_08518 [Fimbriiglobus ruber]